MGHFTRTLTAALCFLTLAATQDTTYEPFIQNSDSRQKRNIDDKIDLPLEMSDKNLPVRDFLEKNPAEVDGQPLFQGDMLLTPSQWEELRERKAINLLNYRWPDGPDGCPLIPYTFHQDMDQSVIMEAINYWMELTCIKFTQVDSSTTGQHIRFFVQSGCWSYVGMRSGGQTNWISIGNGCNYFGIIVHEIGHAIGFFHEQSRTDRDDYVIINYDNIVNSSVSNFYTATYSDDYGVEYDYTSIMHYGTLSFSSNGKVVITTKDPMAQPLIGQRDELSFRDTKLANIIYGCIDKWLANCSLSLDPCQNYGYTDKYCSCVCPPGTAGDSCENVVGGYYEWPEDNEIIYETGYITSPDFPSPFSSTSQAVKWIQAPECYLPQLYFTDFSLVPQYQYCSGAYCCYFNFVELRFDLNTYGDVYCDTSLNGVVVTGTSRELVLFFYSRGNSNYPGFSAEVTFVPDDNCTTTTTTEEPTTETTTTEETTTETTTTESTTTETTTTEETTMETTTAETTTTETTTTETTTAETTTTEITTSETTTTEMTTTTTTTAAPEPPRCTLARYNGIYYWWSPHFGSGNYTNNFRCSIQGRSGLHLALIKIKLLEFHLEDENSSGECSDAVTINHLYGQSTSLCGFEEVRVIKYPSFNFEIVFSTNGVITAPGFNMSLEVKIPSCYKTIQGNVGDVDNFRGPKFAKFCETRIEAPSGHQVEIYRVRTRLRSYCTKNYLLINDYIDNNSRRYPDDASTTRFCGTKVRGTSIISTNRYIFLAFRSTRKGKYPYRIWWRIIPDTS